MSCGIYKIENLINHKKYIGQSIEIEKRWQVHKSSNDNFAIHNALRKYGVENFSFEILEECSKEELNQKECFWINQMNSIAPFGYNMIDGGTNGAALSKRIPVFQYDFTGVLIASYAGINEAGRINKIPGIHISECCNHKRTSAGGFFWSFSSNEKFSQNDIKSHKKCKIIQYDKNGKELARYDSAKIAAVAVGGSSRAITKACRGESKSSSGYQWSYESENEKKGIYNAKAGVKKKVLQFSIAGVFIKEFESLSAASKETNIPLSTIFDCCNEKGKTAGGFKWKYKK